MSGPYNWRRVGLIVFAAPAGLAYAAWAFTAPNVPRYAVALATVCGTIGLAATAALALLVWLWITEDLRPRAVWRKPKNLFALSSEQSALVGQRAFMHHRVRFWGGMLFRESWFFGFIRMGEVEHLRFKGDGK